MRLRPPAMVVAGVLALAGTPAVAAEPGPPPARRPEPIPGDRMVQAGVGVTVAGLLGYGLMAAGLGVGNNAESELLPLTDRDDIDRRRDVLERGRLGNRLAIAGAVTAAAAMGIGITLIVLGRRRHIAHAPRAALGVGSLAGGGVGLRVRGRF